MIISNRFLSCEHLKNKTKGLVKMSLLKKASEMEKNTINLLDQRKEELEEIKKSAEAANESINNLEKELEEATKEANLERFQDIKARLRTAKDTAEMYEKKYDMLLKKEYLEKKECDILIKEILEEYAEKENKALTIICEYAEKLNKIGLELEEAQRHANKVLVSFQTKVCNYKGVLLERKIKKIDSYNAINWAKCTKEHWFYPEYKKMEVKKE